MPNISYLAISLLGALHTATYGAYKDSPYEGFRWDSFVREIAFAALAFSVASFFYDFSFVNWGVLFLTFSLLAKIMTESYKQFIRRESQKQYKIPSMVHLFGKVTHSPLIRLLLGGGMMLAIVGMVYVSRFIVTFVPAPFAGGLIGLLIGVATALGGSYKDGFFEGFDGLKFFRSPLVGLASGLLVGFFTHDPFFLLFATGGLERMISEGYKTFLSKAYVPGKFNLRRPTHLRPLQQRKRLVPLYLATWVAFLLLLFLS